MQFREFGKTGINTIPIGLGTFGMGGDYGPVSEETVLEAMRMTIEKTTDDAYLVIDTAPRYGDGMVEQKVGQILSEFSQRRILVITKGGRYITQQYYNQRNFTPEFLKADLVGSLERLGLEKIFLYQLHGPSLEIIQEGSVFQLLEQFRSEGKIEWYGVSIDDPAEGIAVIEVCQERGYKGLAAIQVIYNILNKKAENSGLFRKAKENGIAVIAREPFQRGLLTDNNIPTNPSPAIAKIIKQYGVEQLTQKLETAQKVLAKLAGNLSLVEVALGFVVSNPDVTLTIPGMRTTDHIEQNFSIMDCKLDNFLRSGLSQLPDLKKLE